MKQHMEASIIKINEIVSLQFNWKFKCEIGVGKSLATRLMADERIEIVILSHFFVSIFVCAIISEIALSFCHHSNFIRIIIP